MKNPYLVVEWNDTETSAKGWLVVYNYVRGSSGGGTRMHPTVTKEEVIRLAHAMAYKYQSIESTTMGGCKAGISYDYKAPDAKDVLRRFLYAISPYTATGVSVGSDLGTNYNYILSVFEEQGIGIPQTPWMRKDPKIQENIKAFDHLMTLSYDGFLMNDMITGYGVAYTTDEAWRFKGGKDGARVVIQGFGCVGASAAQLFNKLGYKVVGIADANIAVYCPDGLDIPSLIANRKPFGELNQDKFDSKYQILPNSKWLELDADILVPAALEDVINKSNVDKVKASLVAEGANIPVSPEADKVLFEKGIDLVPDFLSNSGAIRYYDQVIYGYIPADPEVVVKDLEGMCRRNIRRVFENAKTTKRYQRDVALEIFEPKIQDAPEIS